MLELFLVKQEFAHIILVRGNLLSIALAKCREQTKRPFTLWVVRAILNNLSDGGTIDLLIKQHLVVFKELLNGQISFEIILLHSCHTLVEKVGDPLSHIELVIFIILGAMLQ